jgi:hypothetical protein
VIAASLTAISILWGLAAYFVFRRFTDHVALRKVRKRMYAHLLGIRLYSEEPALVWDAQKALIVDNLRFLALVAKPVLIMALPFGLLYGPMDSIYGWGPLEPGHSAIVTIQLSDREQYTLQPPPGIIVETPPVAVMAENQISWRIRALRPTRVNLSVVTRGFAGEISIHASAGRRESLPGGAWVEVNYPRSDIAIAGLKLPWLAWFLIFSTASAALSALF